MHGVEMSMGVDPGSPEGDKTVKSHNFFLFYDPQHGYAPDQMAGPTGPKGHPGPTGPKGHPGPKGEHGKSPLQMAQEELALAQEELALAQMKELGSVFKIPAHPDPEVQKQMVVEALEAHSGSITKDTIMMCKVLPQAGLVNANGAVYLSPEALQQLNDQLQEKKAQFVTEHQNEPWKAATTTRTSSAKLNMTNTAKTADPIERILNNLPAKWPVEAQKILDEEAKRKGQHVSLPEVESVHLLAPQEYDAQTVFEVVRQVVKELIDEHSEKLLKKVSATIADVIVEERKAWKQAYNALTTDYHTFKTDAEKWSKVFVKEMAELRVEVHQLSGQLVEAKTEVKRLEEENSKLIVKGTLSKSPRKVKVD